MVTYLQMKLFNLLPVRADEDWRSLVCSRSDAGREGWPFANDKIEKSVSKGTVQAPFWSLSIEDLEVAGKTGQQSRYGYFVVLVVEGFEVGGDGRKVKLLELGGTF